MSYNSSVYNESYYETHCGDDYLRDNVWANVFARHADRIIKELNPKTVLDVGCAVGYLVEGLRDRGVEAEGIDVSEYALSVVRDDIKQYCSIQSATEPITKKYDLITCIEVMEHLAPEDFFVAIDNMCSATDMILFSSTPFDFNEESHYSVNEPSYWVERFAYNGFYHDVSYDPSYIAVQAMLFRRENKTQIDLIRGYESRLFALWRENCMLRDKVNISNARIGDLDRGNIEHAREIEEYKNELNNTKNEKDILTHKYEIELNNAKNEVVILTQQYENQLESEIRELKSKHDIELSAQATKFHMLINSEYQKRDEVQNKNECLGKRIRFLEKELFSAIRERDRLFHDNSKLITQNSNFESEKSQLTDGYENRISEITRKAELETDALKSELCGLREELARIKEFREDIYYKIAHKAFCHKKAKELRKIEPKKLMRKPSLYWSPVFNAEEYAKINPDITAEYGSKEKELLKHFIYHGMKEGRVASSEFDVMVYKEKNPDLSERFGEDYRLYYLHFIRLGVNESRICR